MRTVVIPIDAHAVRCPQCGLILHNLRKLGIRHQVGCKCGTEVVVERRRSERKLEGKDVVHRGTR